MIQTFTFHIPLGGRDPVRLLPQLRDVVAKLLKFQHVIRGFRAEVQDGMVRMFLRLAGHNRWNLQADARRIAALVLRRVGLLFRSNKLKDSIVFHRVSLACHFHHKQKSL